MQITESEFEGKYTIRAEILSRLEGVSFSTALETLHSEYLKCSTEKDFEDLLDDWGLK